MKRDDELLLEPSSPPPVDSSRRQQQVRIFRLDQTQTISCCSGKLLAFDFDDEKSSKTTCNDDENDEDEDRHDNDEDRIGNHGNDGDRIGNHGNNDDNNVAAMATKMMGNDATFSEGAVLERDGPALERFYRSECVYSSPGEQRFKQAVTFETGLPTTLKPVRFSSTVVVYTYSTRKRFKDAVDWAPKFPGGSPRIQSRSFSFSETVFARPRTPREVFRTTVVHHDDRRYVGRYVTGLRLGLFAKFVDVSSVVSKREAAKKVVNGAA